MKSRRSPSSVSTPVPSPGIARAAVWVGDLRGRAVSGDRVAGLGYVFGVWYNQRVFKDLLGHQNHHHHHHYHRVDHFTIRITAELIFQFSHPSNLKGNNLGNNLVVDGLVRAGTALAGVTYYQASPMSFALLQYLCHTCPVVHI